MLSKMERQTRARMGLQLSQGNAIALVMWLMFAVYVADQESHLGPVTALAMCLTTVMFVAAMGKMFVESVVVVVYKQESAIAQVTFWTALVCVGDLQWLTTVESVEILQTFHLDPLYVFLRTLYQGNFRLDGFLAVLFSGLHSHC